MQYLRRRGLIHLSLYSISGGNSRRRIADFVVRQVQDWELLPAQPVGSWLAGGMRRALHQRPAPHPLQPPQPAAARAAARGPAVRAVNRRAQCGPGRPCDG